MTIAKKIVLLLYCCFPAAVYVSAQNDSAFVPVQSIAGEFTYFNTDNLNNIYLVNNRNQLKKINNRGDSVGVFNEVRKYGKLFYIDASNPLKLLLYYQNFSTIVVLDRFLMVRNVINLRNQNIFNVKAIANAYDNNIWVFDEGDAKLKKIGENGDLLAETVDCRLLFDTVPSPTQIIDDGGFVHLYDSTRGFFIFDIYGALKNKLRFTHWQNVEVYNNRLYGFANNLLFEYRPGTLNVKEYRLPAAFGDALQKKVCNNKLYLLTTAGLQVFTVNAAGNN